MCCDGFVVVGVCYCSCVSVCVGEVSVCCLCVSVVVGHNDAQNNASHHDTQHHAFTTTTKQADALDIT